jgi:hypothetical protein
MGGVDFEIMETFQQIGRRQRAIGVRKMSRCRVGRNGLLPVATAAAHGRIPDSVAVCLEKGSALRTRRLNCDWGGYILRPMDRKRLIWIVHPPVNDPHTVPTEVGAGGLLRGVLISHSERV